MPIPVPGRTLGSTISSTWVSRTAQLSLTSPGRDTMTTRMLGSSGCRGVLCGRNSSLRGKSQADRSARASGRRGGVGQGVDAAGRDGSSAHAGGRFRLRLRRDGTGRRDGPGRRHAFPDRLEHQDDDGRRDRAAGPGRKAAPRRSGLEVCSGRSQRGRHHGQRPPQDAERPARVHRRAGASGKPRPRPGPGLDPGGTARHRVQASADVRSGRGVLLLQHELSPARPHNRTGRRRAAGPGLSGSSVRTARHEGHVVARRCVERDSRAVFAWLPVRRVRPTP